jgi:tRNA pseudouridine55 synthase
VTTTDDLEGDVVTESPVPDYLDSEIRTVLDQFVGEIAQVPPAFSAIKLEGQTSYKRARRGEQLAMPARIVQIHEICLVRRTSDRITLVARCGKGTYIRALARDIGERLGCGATLARLIRMQVGRLDLASSVTPAELEAATESDTLHEYVLPPDQACPWLRAIVLDEDAARRAVNGQGWLAEQDDTPTARVYSSEGVFIGLARREPDRNGTDDQTWWRLRVMVDDA